MSILRLVHRLLGLGLAAIIVAVGATGGLLLLRDPYYRAVHPELRVPVSSADAARRGEILTAIEARWRTEGVRLVKFPRAGFNVYQVWLHDGSEAFVHSRTGAVIDRWRPMERLPAFLFELHAHLLVERGGTIVNGIAALAAVFMALTGIVLWWPARRGAFRLRRVVPARASFSALLGSHAALGALAVVPVLIFAGTGAALAFYQPTARFVSRVLDAQPPREPDARIAPRNAPTRDWGTLLATLDRTFPDGEAVFYYPGGPDNARLMFRKRLPGEPHPNGRSYIVIDPYTAATVQAIDARAQGPGARLMHAVYPIHAARVGGVPMTALAAFAAVALTLLAAGGAAAYLLRLRRSPRPRADASSLAAPAGRTREGSRARHQPDAA